MDNKPRFKCKSDAQKYAIRAYYARKRSQASETSQQVKKYRFDKKRGERYREIVQPRNEVRERYRKVMAEDFPKDFLSDDEWDYIEAMASWPKK